MAIEWTVLVETDDGRKFAEIATDKAKADARINVLKTPGLGVDGWLEFGGVHIKVDRIVIIRRRQRKKPT